MAKRKIKTKTKKKRYKTPSPKDGRPRIEFSDDQFRELDGLCSLQCGLEEIAAWFKVSEDTIERRVKGKYGITFADHFKQKSVASRVTLRRKMWAQAINKDNITMMIFLSKQKHLLNYTDRVQDDSYEKMRMVCEELEANKKAQK